MVEFEITRCVAVERVRQWAEFKNTVKNARGEGIDLGLGIRLEIVSNGVQTGEKGSSDERD